MLTKIDFFYFDINNIIFIQTAGLEGLSQDEPDFDTPTEQMIQTARMNFGKYFKANAVPQNVVCNYR